MNKKVFFAVSVFSFSLFLMASDTLAQEKTDNIFTLGEIVVEDSSGVQDIAISNTITAEEIESMGAANAAEALQSVPGVNVVRTAKGELNINIQGFQQKNILVLIDGVPYYETKNGPLDLQQIPASIIGKIEVTKGASSVLYGPNALGGVVNIITRKGVKGIAGSVSAEAGLGGYYRGVATLNYGAENGFSILGTVDYRSRDTLYFSDDYKPRETDIDYKGAPDGRPNPRVVDEGDKKDNSDLDSLNLWTRLGYAPTEDVEMYASLYRFDMERGRPFSDAHNKVRNFDGGFSTFGRYDEYVDTGADVGGRVSLNDWWDLRAMAFYHSHQDDYTSYVSEDLEEKLSTSTWDDDSYGFSLFSDTNLDRFGELSVSVQYREDKHKQKKDIDSPWEDSESSTLTFAAEDTLSFGQFTTVLGLAYHDFDAKEIAGLDGYTADSFDPMAGVTWTSENGVQIFGSIAKKTRFPTFSDMEYDDEIYRLDPEKNINYSLGTKYLFFDKAQVALSGFYNDITDRIGEDADDKPVNIDEAKIYGIEIETDTDITDRISMGLNYVYTHARDESADRESDYLADVPEDMFSASLGYMIPKIETRFIVRGTYKGGMIYNTDDEEKEYFTVVDLSLIKKWDNGLSLGGHIYNLFDQNYYEGKGMACNGFDCKVVVQYDF
jgi:outer membrane receptor protein involved in Fe transport